MAKNRMFQKEPESRAIYFKIDYNNYGYKK